MPLVKAWDAIGWDDGQFRIKGGRANYEAVLYNCANGGNLVKLARLEATTEGLREVSRYVAPETLLEMPEEEWAAYAEEFGIKAEASSPLTQSDEVGR